ncbi:MAG: hypothetical protein JSS32_11040 [Verrucomicrobia bacterium]|nr:hypothetical protein [Verrucomicrobiota bacterium]
MKHSWLPLLIAASPLLADLDCCEDMRSKGPYAFSFHPQRKISRSRDFYTYVDGLYLQAKQDGMSFALLDADGLTSPIDEGKIYGFSSNSHDWTYNPGLRAAVGFLCDNERWKFEMAWTWVKITDSRSNHVSGNSVFLPLWLIPQPTPLSILDQSVRAVWDMDCNILDASCSIPYDISPSLRINPYLGLRIAFLDQHFSIHYGGLFGASLIAISHNDQDLWGIGIRGGMDTEWLLGKSFYLSGRTYLSMLASQWEIDQSLQQGTQDGYVMEDDFGNNLFNWDLSLGFGWRRSIRKNRYRVGLLASYEFSEWFNLFQIRRFFTTGPYYGNDRVSGGNFSLNGFSLRFQLDL